MALLPVYRCEVSVETSSGTYSTLNGIENVSESVGRIINTYHFLADGGMARSHATGAAPSFTFTGRRIPGDTAQDFIFGKKYSFAEDAEFGLKIVVTTDPSTTPATTTTITADVTLADCQEYSGATTDDSAISITLNINGTPTIS